MHISAEGVRWFRLRRAGLVTPFPSPEAAASALIGIQAQILPAAGLALWQRTEGLTWAEVEHRLFEQRSLLKLWGQRHTLHLYPSDEWPLLYAALSGQETWWERQLAAQGSDVAAYGALLNRLAELLRERQTMGRSDLRASGLDLPDWVYSSWGGIFADLVRRGHACHARQLGNEGRFAHREYWLPDLVWEPPAPDEARRAVARRYLAAYGPATHIDLAYWYGTQPTNARRWLAAHGDALAEVTVDGRPALALRDDLEALAEPPPERDAWPVRLLYRFDPWLLPHKDKSWIIEPELRDRVWRPAAHIEGTILEHGRLRGTWRYDRRRGGLVITLRPFAPLPDHARAALPTQAQGIAAFFGLPLVDIINE